MNTQIIRPPAFQRPSGKLTLSANQLNLVDDASTLVNLDTIPSEFIDGIEDTVNHRITPGKAGFYMLSACIYFYPVVADTHYEIFIRVNGVATPVAINVIHARIVQPFVISCQAPCHYLDDDDYLELYGSSHSGDNTVDIYKDYTFLAVQRVR